MKVLVTGASGLLGSHVIQLLMKEKIDFLATSLSKPNFLNETNWVKWDLHDPIPTILDERLSGISSVIHIGALVPKLSNNHTNSSLFDINVRACLTLATWSSERNLHFIYVSGATVYQDPFQSKIKEEAPLGYSGVGGFYGYTKLLAEDVCRFFETEGLALTILRASSIYGYGMTQDKMISNFINLAQQGATIHLSEPVNDSVNLVHASDVAQSLVSVLKDKVLGIYNIAYSKEYSIFDIASICTQLMQNGAIKINKDESSKQQGRVKFSLDIQKAIENLNFNPKTDLYAGISHIIDKSFNV